MKKFYDLLMGHERATREAEHARLLRVMLADGESPPEVAERFGVTQPAISSQLARERTDGVQPSEFVEAGGSALRQVAANHGLTRLVMFGSVARCDDRPDPDLALLVQPPANADLFDMLRLEETLARIAGRDIDLVSYHGLDQRLYQNILRDKVLL